MKPLRTLSAAKMLALVLTLVFGSATVASAAVTLHTSPFNSFNVQRGAARCLVTNGSTTAGTATVTMYRSSGAVLDSASDKVLPHQTADPTAAFDMVDAPTYCECTVPSATTWRCSFAYMDTLD